MESRVRRGRKGFTLVELLVVVLIITMLATLIAPKIFRGLRSAKKRMAKIGITKVESAVASFYTDCGGQFPMRIDDLLLDPGDLEGWDGPYLDAEDIEDPWKHPYYYEPPPSGSDKCLVMSYGRDGSPGGEGEDADIDNQPEMQ
jgi:general secretion pathway protein G